MMDGGSGGDANPGVPATPTRPRPREVSIPCSTPTSEAEAPASLSAARGAAGAGGAWEAEATGLLGKEGSRRPVLLATIGLAAIAACAAVAALTAAEAGGGDAGGEAGGPAQASIRATPRRASANSSSVGMEAVADSGAHGPGCHSARSGEPCHRHVSWAMKHGIHANPEWYPGLSASSTFAEFQQVLNEKDEFADCPVPCGVKVRAQSGQHWCSAPAPGDGLNMKDCSSGHGRERVKVLTYNLFWWNLFGRRRGNGGSAGNLIRSATGTGPFDVMAFQEADNVWWPLRDAGMTQNDYESESALGMAVVWRTSAWRKLQAGIQRIAEDRPDQWYGARGVLWVRLQSVRTARTILFANHHGPLPVGTGGICGGEATAYNILGLLRQRAQPSDLIVLTGDFNADSRSETFRTLHSRINHVYSGSSFGGVDHVFSNCAGNSVLEATNLGSGGSDHDALMVVFHV